MTPQTNFNQDIYQDYIPSPGETIGVTVPTGAGPVRNSVKQDRPGTPNQDPHAIRWMYGAGWLVPSVNARTTGMQTGLVPQGALVAFEDFKIEEDNPSLEIGEPTYIQVEVTALEAVTNASNETNGRCGVVIEVLIGETSDDLIARIFEIVHPEFADLGHVCPEGLQICPTCRVQMVSRDFISERVRQMANEYGVNPATCYAVADGIRAAATRLIEFYSAEWGKILQELADSKTGRPGLRRLFPEHHYIRQCLHAPRPENEQAEVAAGYGEKVAAAMQQNSISSAQVMAEAIKSVAAEGNDRTAQVLESLAASQAQTNQLILALLQNQQSAQSNPAQSGGAPLEALEATPPTGANKSRQK